MAFGLSNSSAAQSPLCCGMEACFALKIFETRSHGVDWTSNVECWMLNVMLLPFGMWGRRRSRTRCMRGSMPSLVGEGACDSLESQFNSLASHGVALESCIHVEPAMGDVYLPNISTAVMHNGCVASGSIEECWCWLR